MAFYRRRLPHIHLLDHATFVTFRLHGSLPAETKGSSPTGPQWLGEPVVASVVVEAIHYNATVLVHFELHAFVVMSNHVHLLLTPRIPLSKALQNLKSITAKRANLLLSRAGPFWREESFDHVVRNDAQFRRIVRYIHRNPVRAGIVATPEEFPWSSAWAGLGARPT